MCLLCCFIAGSSLQQDSAALWFKECACIAWSELLQRPRAEDFSRRLKYNKKLPGNRVRNNLAVGHVEKFDYCVRESCQVSLMKALCVSLFGFVLFSSCSSFLLGERKLLSPAVCLTLHSLCSLSLTGSFSTQVL